MMREKPAPKAGVAALAPPEKRTDQAMAQEALARYRKAQEFLRQGNWTGYGEELKKMEEALKAREGKK